MTRKEIVEDLSVLTTIPRSALQKLLYKAGTVIAYGVQESLRAGENITSIDIGFGILNVKVSEDEVFYKFIPSSSFEQDIINGVTGKGVALVADIEDTLKSRIMNTYKDLF